MIRWYHRVMYYMEDVLEPVKRMINPDMPYRFDGMDGKTYSLVIRLLEEGDGYNAEADAFLPKVRVVGDTVPDYPMKIGEVIRLYHVDNPGTAWVDLKFAVSHDGVYSSGQFFGEGSIIMLGPLRDTLPLEESNA
jgi:hypothetical protein